MGDEYTESVDTFSDVDVSDVADDIPEDIPDDIPEDIPEDDYSDVEDTVDDIPEDIPEDVPEDDYSDVEDVAEDIPEDVPEDDYSDAEDVVEDIPEDVPEDISEDDYSDVEDVAEDIPEDAPKDISEDDYFDVEDVAEDIPEDIPEDVLEDNYSEVEEAVEDISEDVITDETADVAGDAGAEETSDSTEDNITDEAIDTQEDAVEDAGAEETSDLTEDTATDKDIDIQEDAVEDSGAEETSDLTEDTATDKVNDIQEDAVEDAGTEGSPDLTEDTTTAEDTDTQEDAVEDDGVETYHAVPGRHGDIPVEVPPYKAIPNTQRGSDQVPQTEETEAPYTYHFSGYETHERPEVENPKVLRKDNGVSNNTFSDFNTKTEDSSYLHLENNTEIQENYEDAFKELSDYMNEHNYGKDDYDTYSQDPEWQRLHRKAFPDYVPPETNDTNTQESAFRQLSDYMNQHNYGRDDYDTYSQDPEWQRLHSAAFPNSDINSPTQEITRSVEISETPDVDFAEMSDEQKLGTLEKKCRDNRLVRIVDFHDFDPDVAMSMTDALSDAKKDFPELDVSYLGSIDSQVKGIHDTVAQSYENELRQLNGTDFSDEEYQTAANEYADNYIKKVGLDDSNDAFAWSLKIPSEYDPTGGGLSKYNGVAVNNRFAGDNKFFTECKINEVATNHKPIGCDTPRATADHELGHEIDKLLNASDDKQINDMYNKMISEGNARSTLSTYSATNVKEFIAEAYSEYRNNPLPREYSTAVYNRLIELRNMKGGIRS